MGSDCGEALLRQRLKGEGSERGSVDPEKWPWDNGISRGRGAEEGSQRREKKKLDLDEGGKKVRHLL